MDSPRNPDDFLPPSDDLSALAWVHDEVRRSLESAHKALRRYLKESDANAGSDTDVVDPAVLRTARQQIHQGVGALELVGLPAAATLLRACEAAVQRVVAKPHKLTPKFAEDIEHASFALLDYLARVLAVKPVSPLSMFPQYRAVQEAAGADRVHPADLWAVDWRWNVLPDAGVITASRQPDGEAQQAMERHILALMRVDSRTTSARMSELCAGLGAGADLPQVATLWRLAAAVFEAQAEGLLKPDVFSKRLGSRLLAQLRMIGRGQTDVSERLAQDLLFFCAQSRAPNERHLAPRLASVRAIYDLTREKPVDYDRNELGKFDPAWLVQARKRVIAAKDSWSAVAGGELHRLNGLAEQVTLVGESLRKLFSTGEALAVELQQSVAHTHQARTAPPAALAMEVATSLLYIEASLEDAEFDNPVQAARVQRLAARIGDVRRGAPPAPLEAWMEALYRRVSDRQTMGSVVQELRASLSDAEKRIDQFFRQPTDGSVLMTVPQQFSSMRGVLSVLGMTQASAALLRMRDDVDGLSTSTSTSTSGSGPTSASASVSSSASENAPESPNAANAAIFTRLAGNLGALGFLIDMLSVQPQMAKSLFAFDAERGTLSPVMGRVARRVPVAPHALDGAPQVDLIEHAQLLALTAVRDDVPLEEVSRDLVRLSQDAAVAEQPALLATVRHAQEALDQADGVEALASVRGELSDALIDFVATASGPIGLDMPTTRAPVLPPIQPTIPLSGAVDLAEDDEMREIFLEEAREVLEDAGSARDALATDPSDLTPLITLRRAFHTLKGSSRMVGLTAFGDASWALEQVYNARLGAQQPADDPLIDLTGWSLDYLAAWVEDIAAQRPTTHEAAVVEAAVAALAALDMPFDSATPLEDRLSSSAFGGGDDFSPTELDEPMALPQVDEEGLPPLDAAEFALSFPSELPSAEELEFPPSFEIVTEPESPVQPDGFELDFSAFDAPLSAAEPAGAAAVAATVAATADIATTESRTHSTDDLGVQMDAAYWAQSFDTQPADLPTVPAPLDEARSQEQMPFAVDLIGLDLDSTAPAPLDEVEIEALPADLPEAVEASADAASAEDTGGNRFDSEVDSDQVKIVGPLRIGIPLFNIYLAEADELSRRLSTELSEWAMELHRPVGESAIALAHSLAGSSATVGFVDLSQLARTLEHALARTQTIGSGTDEEGHLFVEVAEEIRRLLHQFAAGFLKEPPDALVERLAEHELTSAQRLDAATAEADSDAGLESESEAESDFDTDVDADADVSSSSDIEMLPDLVDESELIHRGEVDAAANDSRLAPLAEVDDADGAMADEPEADDLSASGLAEVDSKAASTTEQTSASAPDSVVSVDSVEWIDLADAVEVDASHPDPLPPAEPVVEPDAFEAPHSVAATRPAPLGDTNFDALALPELKALEPLSLETLRATAEPHAERRHVDDDIDAVDAVDVELFPIFEEEADELLPQLGTHLRAWSTEPADKRHAAACMRTLHTFKGGARLAGAMRLGELAHRLESRIEALTAQALPAAVEIRALEDTADQLTQTFQALKAHDEQAYADAVSAAAEAVGRDAALQTSSHASALAADGRDETATPATTEVSPTPEVAARVATPAHDPVPRARGQKPRRTDAELPPIDWMRFEDTRHAPRRSNERTLASQAAVRVRVPLLDRLVNQAGEVSITRSRIESEVVQIKVSLVDLTENLERLRQQLRDIELQAETQMSSRLEAAKAASQNFDPLEFDRFTRFQELTRMMAESVNDVATVQRSLHRTLEVTEDELVAQARLTRDMQDDLLRTRMVEFESLSDRLYRVVRQTAKETGKQVRLDIVGGSFEIDRGVLDRITGSFEHLLRNSITHGVESPEARVAAGKDASGRVVVSLTHEGNEVGVEFRDDGAGLNLARIRAKAEALGMVAADQQVSDAELADLIFSPGFSTAETVTELAGRGVGMDVVRSEVNAMGGRIETSTSAGQGTSFKLVLPLTTAVTQVVMVRMDQTTVAIPSTLIEIVRRATVDEVAAAYRDGSYAVGDRTVPFHWLGALLHVSARSLEAPARTRQVLIIRSAQQRIALHVDEVLGNQEVVVKHLGPQLARMPGLAGVTLLASGTVALIYNPVALASLYGPEARQSTLASLDAVLESQVTANATANRPAGAASRAMSGMATHDRVQAPLVLVVDDSLTVRRVTQRMLVREGYRVTLAKDGLDALERLAEEKPQMVLSDIEMPRMDGFDLVRNIRADDRLRDLPVIMITSRIAQKHRDYAAQLGVDHYLGKPYSEDDLLALVGRYTSAMV